MTTLTTDRRIAPDAGSRSRRLTQLLAGAAAFDGVMGVVCLAAGAPIASALGLRGWTVGVTGGLFLLAAVEGVVALRRPAVGVRWIVAANAVFGAWCIAALGFDTPDGWGAALLAASAAASGSTALVERRMAASAQ